MNFGTLLRVDLGLFLLNLTKIVNLTAYPYNWCNYLLRLIWLPSKSFENKRQLEKWYVIAFNSDYCVHFQFIIFTKNRINYLHSLIELIIFSIKYKMSDKPSITNENIEQCNLTTSDHGVKNEKILGDSCPTDTD